jgi:hypothetical protein
MTWVVAVVAACSVLASGIATRHVRRHLLHGSDAVPVLMMVPVYSAEALMAVACPPWAPLLEALRSAYEAYVLYAFLRMMVRRLHTGLPGVPHVWPVSRVLRSWEGDRFLCRCVRGTLQYSLLMAPAAVATLACWGANVYEKPSHFSPRAAYPWLALVRNASQLLAMYSLLLFYRAARAPLRPFRPLGKFAALKGIVFFTFWQGVLVTYLGWRGALPAGLAAAPAQRASALKHLLIAVEMVGFALQHRCVFPLSDFPVTAVFHLQSDGMTVRSLWDGMWSPEYGEL